MRIHLITVAALAALCSACSSPNASASGPHATVTTRDGNRYTGTITQSSVSKMTLLDDSKATHEISADQIESVAYDAPAAASAAPVNAPPPNAPPASGNAPASVPVAPSTPAATESHTEHYHPPQTVIRTKTHLIPVGTQLSVRTEETIDSGVATEGQTYAAELARDVADANGDVVIPRGSNVVMVIRSASKGGRFKGTSDLALELQSVSVQGQKYLLDTDVVSQKGKDGFGVNKRTGIFTGGGAAVGAIIGAIAGGGKGAAIGSGAGAGGGALTQILTKGGSIKVPAETILTFRMEAPLRVVAAQ